MPKPKDLKHDSIADAMIAEALSAGHTPPAPTVQRRDPALVEHEQRITTATNRQGRLSSY